MPQTNNQTNEWTNERTHINTMHIWLAYNSSFSFELSLNLFFCYLWIPWPRYVLWNGSVKQKKRRRNSEERRKEGYTNQKWTKSFHCAVLNELDPWIEIVALALLNNVLFHSQPNEMIERQPNDNNFLKSEDCFVDYSFATGYDIWRLTTLLFGLSILFSIIICKYV